MSGTELGKELANASRVSRSQGHKPKKSRSGRFVLQLAGIILFVILALMGFVKGQQLLGNTSPGPDGVDPANSGKPRETSKNILIIGTDARGKELARSDTLILANIDTQKKTARLLSLPRDTYADIPGHGSAKINHAHAYGGYQLSKETVEGLLGVSIDNYIETNFQGFENVIDILGGLTLDVEQRMYRPSENINLYPGVQQLDGEKALAYVRFRDYKLGDIDRVEHQQIFLKALYEQTFRLATLPKLPGLIQQILQNVSTDLTITEVIQLATAMRGLGGEQLETLLLPGSPDNIDGISYWMAESDRGREFIEGIEAEQQIPQTSFGVSEHQTQQ
ncbi:MAG: LCP family protein [Bacillota bacterium]